MTRSFRKRIIACLLALCTALSLGCGKKATEAAPIVLPTPTPAPQAQAGGELRLPMPTNARINAPFSVNTKEMLGFYSLLYESLVTLDTTGQISACLAEHWSCDESGRVWTFNLRAARWHDTGNKLTAADVVFSFERIRAMGADSYYAYSVAGVQSMEAVDELTLAVTMQQAGIGPLYALTFPIARTDMETGTTLRPIGTGPYKVDAIGAQSVTLTVNENWWKQPPYIQKITFYARDNNETALASYAAGQLDMTQTSNVSVGKYREEGVTKITDMMTQTAELLIINNNNADLRDNSVRKAVAYALDRSTIITNVYMNRAQECDVPIAPDSWLYDTKSKVYDYDSEKAAALFAEAGWADSDEDGVLDKAGSYNTTLSLRLLVCASNDGTRTTAANMLAAQLAEAGVVVTVTTAAYSLDETESEFQTLLTAGEFDLALMGLSLARNADVQALLNANGKCNYGHYSDAAMEKLLQNVVTAADEASCRSAASAFELQFVEELPCIMLYFRKSSLVYTAGLQGVSDVREPNIFRNIEKWYMYTDQNT